MAQPYDPELLKILSAYARFGSTAVVLARDGAGMGIILHQLEAGSSLPAIKGTGHARSILMATKGEYH